MEGDRGVVQRVRKFNGGMVGDGALSVATRKSQIQGKHEAPRAQGG